MDLDDEVCLCFHVTQRKLRNYLRNHRLQQASQLSECQGAGTGCGWCRPILERLFRIHQASTAAAGGPSVDGAAVDLPSADDYARQREAYLKQRDSGSTA